MTSPRSSAIHSVTITIAIAIGCVHSAFANDINGTLQVKDALDGGGFVGVDNVPVRVMYSTMMGSAIRRVVTDETGYWQVSLPNGSMDVTPIYYLSSALVRVLDEGDVAVEQDLTKSLSPGDSATYTTTYRKDDQIYKPLNAWRATWDVMKMHQAYVGPWPVMRQLTVNLKPDAPPSGGYFDPVLDHVVLGTDMAESKKWSNRETYAHEIGHWFAHHDSAPIVDYDLCAGFQLAVWPFSEVPYAYSDPAAGSSCTHNRTSYETEGVAMSEGFAGFYSLLHIELLEFDANWPVGLPPTAQDIADAIQCDENYSINFDLMNRETNIMQTLCDLVDTGDEQHVAMHSFVASGDRHELDAAIDLEPGFSIGQNNEHAFWMQGDDVGATDFSTRIDTNPFWSPPSLGAKKPRSDGYHLCVLQASDDGFDCKQLATRSGGPVAGTGEFEVEVTPAHFVVDHQVVDDGNTTWLHILQTYLGSYWVRSVALPDVPATVAGGWVTVVTDPDPVAPTHIAVSSNSYFLARGNRVSACLGAVCVDAAGDGSTGYRRGDPLQARFTNISGLGVAGNDLFIIDDKGVSQVDALLAGNVEQRLGVGDDDVFLNNLSRRSVNIDGKPKWYAVNADGTDIVQDDSFQDWPDDTSRIAQDVPEMRLSFDGPEIQKMYCEQDLAAQPLEMLVRGYRLVPNASVNATTFLVNYGQASGIDRLDLQDLVRINWIVLDPGSCDFPTYFP